MYEVTADTPPGDYQTEGFPDGFELERENVLILQNHDMELGDIEFVAESIRSALRDLAVVSYHHTQVIAAKASDSLVDRVRILANARNNRERIQSRYGRATIIAKEDLMSGSFIIALEEEDKQERGLFRRILDKIVAGFKWLWDKMKGLFAAGDDPDEIKSGAEEATKAIEAAAANGVDLATLDVDNFGIQRAFGFLGSPITGDKVVHHLADMVAVLNHIKVLAKAGSDAYLDIVNGLRTAGADSGKFKTISNGIASRFQSAVSGFAVGSADDFSKLSSGDAAGLADFVKSHSGSKIYKLDNLCGGSFFVFAMVPMPDGGMAYRSGFSNPAVDTAGKIDVTPFDLSDVKRVYDCVEKLSAAAKENNKTLNKNVDDNGARIADLQRAVDAIANTKAAPGAEEGNDATVQAARFLGEVGSAITNLFSCLVSANKAAKTSNVQAKRYLDILQKTAKSGKTKEEPSDETKK